MKKLLFIICLSYISQAFYAQEFTVYDNFDNIRNVEWGFWDNEQGGAFNESTTNPDTTGLNSSALVAKFSKTSGSHIYTHAFFELEEPLDLSENHIFRMQVYSEQLHTVKFKLEGDTDPYEVDVNIAEINTWHELEFDFSAVSTITAYNKIVIFINCCITEEAGIYYIDNLVGPYFDTSPTALSAVTNEEGNEIQVSFSKAMNDPSASASNFSVLVNNVENAVSSASLSSSNANDIILELSDIIQYGQIVKLAYIPGELTSTDGEQLMEFSDLPVSNLSIVGNTGEWIWADEFNDGIIDAAKWTHEVGENWHNNELQAYTDAETNSYVEDGVLKIVAREETYGSRNYTSARMITKNKGDWRYGRMEASIKLPYGQGIWPAFWMMPTDDVYGGWPNSGEIDMMEYLGHETNKVYGTIHYSDQNGNHDSKGGYYVLNGANFNEDFNLFAVEWKDDQIEWFVNNTLYYRATVAGMGSSPWPFDQEFFIILNIAVGGNWPGNPDETTVFPQTMEVDYVRVYDESYFSSVEHHLNQEKINLFPNPVSKNSRFTINQQLQKGNIVSIYSINGSLLKEINIKNNSESLNISTNEFQEGVYFIKIQEETKISTIKLVVS